MPSPLAPPTPPPTPAGVVKATVAATGPGPLVSVNLRGDTSTAVSVAWGGALNPVAGQACWVVKQGDHPVLAVPAGTGATLPQVRLRRTTSQSVPSGVFTSIDWNQEDADTHGFITVTASTVTIPAGLGGLYAITANAVGSGLTGSGHLGIVPTSGTLNLPADLITSLDIAVADRGALGIVIPLLAGDSFVVQVRHTTGANANFTAWCSCVRVGG